MTASTSAAKAAAALSISNSRVTGNDQHAEYEISVKGSASVWRRYRQFDELAVALRKDGMTISQVFPPKRLFGGSSPSVVYERKYGLEAWLRAAVTSVADRNSPQAARIKDFVRGDPWFEEAQHGATNLNVSGAVVVIKPNESKLRDIVSRFMAAALSPSPYSSLSRVSSSNGSKAKLPDGLGDFDQAAFREALEATPNVFVVIKSTKNGA